MAQKNRILAIAIIKAIPRNRICLRPISGVLQSKRNQFGMAYSAHSKRKTLEWSPTMKIISAFGTSMDKKSKPSLITFSERASRLLAIAAGNGYGSSHPKRCAPPASLRLNAARQNQ
jgi:hypothetical protein